MERSERENYNVFSLVWLSMRPRRLCWTPGIRKCRSSAAINEECWTIATGTVQPAQVTRAGAEEERGISRARGKWNNDQESWTLTWMVRDGIWVTDHSSDQGQVIVTWCRHKIYWY